MPPIPFTHQLLAAFDAIEHRHEVLMDRPPVAVPRTPGWMGTALEPGEWTWAAPRGTTTSLAGPVGVQLGWISSYIDAVADRRDPVVIVAHEDLHELVMLVLIAHGGIRLDVLRRGDLRAGDWPRLSARLGALAEAPVVLVSPTGSALPAEADDASLVACICPDDDLVRGAGDAARTHGPRVVLGCAWAGAGATVRLEPEHTAVRVQGVGRWAFSWPTLQVVKPWPIG
ncbi:hypothetical protein [Euzebya sp.]|uniref:hypothetical protein n=1 Tax=Euzebya sp. TaxID=1971409 RepID=UPI0035142EFA